MSRFKEALSPALILLGVVLVTVTATVTGQTNTRPVLVRSAKQARQIGESALMRKFGKTVQAERPFHAKLTDRVWEVTGTTYCQEQLPRSDFYCPEWHWVRISAQDGHIVASGISQ